MCISVGGWAGGVGGGGGAKAKRFKKNSTRGAISN